MKMLEKTEYNGAEAWTGLVQFTRQDWLGDAFDAEGNRYHRRGLLGFVIVEESIRKHAPACVVAVKNAANEYTVAKWC